MHISFRKQLLGLTLCAALFASAAPAASAGTSKLPYIDNGGDLWVPDTSTNPVTAYASIVMMRATRASIIFPNHKFRRIVLHRQSNPNPDHEKGPRPHSWEAHSKQKGLWKFLTSSRGRYTYKACNKYGCVKAHYGNW